MDHNAEQEVERLNDLYRSLEKRISRLEEALVSSGQITTADLATGIPETLEPESREMIKEKGEDSIEMSIGEYGMAWIGNIVLLFGLVFLFQYLQSTGFHFISAVMGFLSVLAVYTVSYFMRKSYPYMANLLYYNGHLLFFFITLRLHFFTEEPIIQSKTVGLILLLIVISIQTWMSIRKKSQVGAGVVLLMVLITGIISNTNHFMLVMTVVTALLTLYYSIIQGWSKLIILFITLIYLTHLIWLLNNPIMGNETGGLKTHHFGYIYLFACGFIFSLLAVMPRKESFSDNLLITSIIWNAVGFTFILGLTVLNFFLDDYINIFSAIASFCLIYSLVLQARVRLKIAASIYALYAFVAISVTIYGIYKFPDSYFLLAIQSLLVVSMALWFRSKFIVVMNTFLLLGLLVAYLKGGQSGNSINFSFAVVPIITARIINWKRDRLKIKTEFLRNIYLITGFFMTLFSLYHAVPKSYVTVSWILSGILFFVLSILIRNVKYRWLAIGSMICSAIYLFIVDLSNIGIGYRVVAFLFLAVISIGVSIYYSRRLKQKKEDI